MRREARALLVVLAFLAAGCGSDDPADEPRTVEDWQTSTHPVETGGLIWAMGSTVHLSDGTTIDTGGPIAAYVVAGDGVYLFPAEDEEEVASTSFADRELLFADRDGTVSGTGLILPAGTLSASPDGRYLAGIDMVSGEQDDYGTPVATAVVLDLKTGEQVLRSSEGMGDPDEDDLAVLYENVGLSVTLTDNIAYVDATGNVVAYDLATGESETLPDGEDPPGDDADPQVSPDGAWRIVDVPGLRDRVTSADGQTVTPQPGTSRWALDLWVNDRTLVGTAVTGPGRGKKVDPRDTTTLMTCTVPTGACDVIEKTTGEHVVFPMGHVSNIMGFHLQDGEGSDD